MATCGSGTKITPLVGSGNYATWKVQVTMALKKEGVWKIVTGEESAPTSGDRNAFDARLDKALAIIVLSIDTSLIYLLGEPEDPKVVWKKLQNQFQKKSWANKLHLRKKLYALQYDNSGPVEGHIKSMIETFSELAIVGSPIDEEDQVAHLLASLPENYDTLVTALEALKEVPDLETVIEKITYFEKKSGKTSYNEGVFASKGELRCYYCKREGHFKRDCPAL